MFPDRQRGFSAVHDDRGLIEMPENARNTFDLAWSRLQRIEQLEFNAVSTMTAGWNGVGQGRVTVQHWSDDQITFDESGNWTPAGGQPLRFSNRYRWTRDRKTARLRLEHLRFGDERPVLLFDLRVSGEHQLRSELPHNCGEDVYSAWLQIEATNIRLDWSIHGPRKNESIDYVYT